MEGWNTKKPHLKSLNFFQENSLDAGIQDRRTSILHEYLDRAQSWLTITEENGDESDKRI